MRQSVCCRHLEMTDSCSLSIGSRQFVVSGGVGVLLQNWKLLLLRLNGFIETQDRWPWEMYVDIYNVRKLHRSRRFVSIYYRYDLTILPGGPEKTSWTFAWRYATERWNESAEKHVCNEQTSSNVSIKFHLKRFHISHCTREIVLHVIKQCVQAVRHLCCWLYAGYTRTSQSYQSTDQQKICWIGPPFCFARDAKCLFHCNIAFLTVWSSISCHLFLITFPHG